MRHVLKTVPEIKNGSTYVPVEFLSDLMELDIVINDSQV